MKRLFSAARTVAVVTDVMLLVAEWTVRWLYSDETVLYPRYHTDVQYGDYTLRRIRLNSRFRHTSIDGSWEFVTLVPKPRVHLTRHHGVFAPHSRWRAEVTPAGRGKPTAPDLRTLAERHRAIP